MVTIKDIANEVGVSYPTVSLVLNGKAKLGRISDRVSQKVRDTAARLGYARNEIARSMVTGKNEVIAFVSANMGLVEYTGRIQEGILREASSNNYSIKFYYLDRENQHETARNLIAHRVAGVIFHAPDTKDFAFIQQEMRQYGIPVAMVNLNNNTREGFGVTTDDNKGTADAVKYLSGLGHRQIIYITSKGNYEYLTTRHAGYIEGMKLYVNSEEPRTICITGTNDFQDMSCLEKLLSEPQQTRPTAVLCAGDTIAMNIFRTAYHLDIKIPEKLSIVGFGDLEVGRFAPVPLTTVAQPFEEMGKIVVAKLIEAINMPDKYKKDNLKLKSELVIRESARKVDYAL